MKLFDKIHNRLIALVVGKKPVMMNVKVKFDFDSKTLSLNENILKHNN